jgi:hypothetical protein
VLVQAKQQEKNETTGSRSFLVSRRCEKERRVKQTSLHKRRPPSSPVQTKWWYL